MPKNQPSIYSLLKKYKWGFITFILILSTLCILLVGIILQPAIFQGLAISNKSSEIGDAIGGITAPLIGIFTAALMFLAFWVQYQFNEKNFDILETDILNRDNQFKDNLEAKRNLQRDLINHETEMSLKEDNLKLLNSYIDEINNIEKYIDNIFIKISDKETLQGLPAIICILEYAANGKKISRPEFNILVYSELVEILLDICNSIIDLELNSRFKFLAKTKISLTLKKYFIPISELCYRTNIILDKNGNRVSADIKATFYKIPNVTKQIEQKIK